MSNFTAHSLSYFCEKYGLLDKTIIIGISGGPDSIFLLHQAASLHHEKKINCIAAHFNHEWRAEESQQDLIFCQKMAEHYSIPFVCKSASQLTFSSLNSGSREAQARAQRRFFLKSVLEDYNAAAIFLAHHRDDHLETFFIRLIRGAGLTGLCGIREKNGIYYRPLLNIEKNDILTYLHKKNIPYRIDSTNNSPLYLRNRIRAELIPTLQKIDPRAIEKCLTSLNHLEETEQFLEQLSHTAFHSVTKKENDAVVLSLSPFFTHHPVIQHRILLLWLCSEKATFTPTKNFFEEIDRFFRSPHGGAHQLSTQWRIKKQKGLAWIEKNEVI